MANKSCAALLLVALVFAQALVPSSAQDCDSSCMTRNCDNDGVCICEFPDNSTILDGDRPFLGGEFCSTNLTMCDGTNSFWCENGACNEIVQGENYTCICSEGYSGDHCELQGVPCGDSYCYHEAECLQTDVLCDCPADWKGSDDCSVETLKSSVNGTSVEPVTAGASDKDKWYFPFSVAVGVIVVVMIVVLGTKLYKKRTAEGTQFQQLKQVQMRGFIDDDDEAFSHEPFAKGDRT